MKKFFKDFKAFATKGNIVDLAVAVIVGGAFGKIVTSLVNDVIMPLISLAVGGLSVADWKWVITPAKYNAEGVLVTAETALKYGNFIQTIFDFLIIAFFIFIAIRIFAYSEKKIKHLEGNVVNKIKAKKNKGKLDELVIELSDDKNNVTPKKETTEDLLKDIRELLKEKNNKETIDKDLTRQTQVLDK